jgi:hypothetical protein
LIESSIQKCERPFLFPSHSFPVPGATQLVKSGGGYSAPSPGLQTTPVLYGLVSLSAQAAHIRAPPSADANGRAPPVIPLLATDAEPDSGPTPALVPHRLPRGPARPSASSRDLFNPTARTAPLLSPKTLALELHAVAANPSRAAALEPLVRRPPAAKKVARSFAAR